MKQVLLFLPRLACALACVGIILAVAPPLALLMLLADDLAGPKENP